MAEGVAAAFVGQGRAESGAAEWREGYPVVITGFFGVGIAVLAAWSIGLFIEPIQKELGWGRGQISAGLIVLSCVAFVGAPIVGRTIDRIGTRKIGIAGVILYSVAIAGLGSVGAQIWQWWALWLFVAFGYILVTPTLWAVAVARRFDRQRATALAITMCGSGVLLIFLPTLLTRLIAEFGWRTCYLFLGGGAGCLLLPLVLAFLRDAAPTAPDGRTKASVAEEEMRKAQLWSCLRSSRFLRLAMGAFLMTIATIGIQVHFIPLVSAEGVDRPAAALMAGMIGVGSITGRLTCGFLMDRWRGQIVGGAFFALPALSSLLLLDYNGGLVVGSAIAFVQGLALGAELDVITYLVSRYFGLRNYGTLVGTLMGVLVLGNGLGPTLAGFTYDATGSYLPFILMTVPAFLCGAVLVGTLGDYPARGRVPHQH